MKKIEERTSETRINVEGLFAAWIIFVVGLAVGFLMGVLV
jgi:hypothetical protein